MKKTFLFAAFLAALTLTDNTEAALYDRGGGMIFDDVLGITWLQDANYSKTSGYDADGLMDWQQATTWADQLVYGGFDDWRLPTTSPVDGQTFNFSWAFDGSTDSGYGITGTHSEMMYMYYINLGNISPYTPSGASCNCSWGLINKAPFENLFSGAFWPEDDIDYPGTDYLLYFNFVAGSQAGKAADSTAYAWAVRDGDVVVAPIPSAAILITTGLFGLAALRSKFSN